MSTACTLRQVVEAMREHEVEWQDFHADCWRVLGHGPNEQLDEEVPPDFAAFWLAVAAHDLYEAARHGDVCERVLAGPRAERDSNGSLFGPNDGEGFEVVLTDGVGAEAITALYAAKRVPVVHLDGSQLNAGAPRELVALLREPAPKVEAPVGLRWSDQPTAGNPSEGVSIQVDPMPSERSPSTTRAPKKRRRPQRQVRE